MSFVAAAMVPSAPLLVPALAAGSAAADARLRDATFAAVHRMLTADGDAEVVVVGLAPETTALEGTWDWSGFGVRDRGATAGGPLPLSLALGAWLLDTLAPGTPRTYLGVADGEAPAACAALGAGLATTPVRLLVVGDGSARRSEKAPGYLDPRAAPFDALAELALFAGDPAALLDLDQPLATELMASGRAAWQVLAGATAGTAVVPQVSYVDAPYGVGYVVATWIGA